MRGMYTDPVRVHAHVPAILKEIRVFIYHEIFNTNQEEVQDLKARYREGKVGDVEVKDKLAVAINLFLEPLREKRETFAQDKGLVEQIIL